MTDDKNNEKIDLNKKLKEAKLKAAQETEKTSSTIKQKGEDELAKLREELAQMTETAKRTMADMQNLRRRYEEEKKSLVMMANTDLIKDILPIFDNFKRAQTHAPKDANEETTKWLEGIGMSITQLEKLLQDFGVKKIESLGQKFNPDFHEALAQDKGEKDIVLEELESGYTLGDKVLRHAKVKVGNGE
ncbi:MAG: nucleotide exchange factor GrpE [Candidatus Peregrinibacteria bacterium]|nr:nucleotide exchange factor GrpE [Candidatus Peregrinibacteria bacterium]